MNTLWYKFKFAVQEDLEKFAQKKTSQNAADRLNETICEAEQQTKAVGVLLDRQRVLRDEIVKEQQEAERMTERRAEQLRLAEASGDEELIRYAADETENYRNRRDELRVLAEETTDSMIQLERRFESMKHRVQDMRVRRLKLMGEENVSRANQRMDRIFNTDLTPAEDGVPDSAEKTPADVATMRQRLEKLSAEEASITEIV